MSSFAEVAQLLRQHEVGRRAWLDTPFGRRLVTYADHTATGRYLHFVEAWIRRIRPYYANTHTAVSSTGRIMTTLREKARDVVRRELGADPDDEILFVGSGATAAVHKLVGLLGWRIPEPLERRYALSQHIPPHERPVVFLGPYEHHSNELPWIESIAEVVEVRLRDDGQVDLADLEAKLVLHRERPSKLGTFSAASNVTGVLSDVGAIAQLLHQHGALACFDYAAAGPYVPIDMHPPDPARRMDAVFLSMHKFIGGPGASGILAVNRRLIHTHIPERPGGGTVDYVVAPTREGIDYTSRMDEREEGGTPDILGDVRAGTAFLVKQMVGAQAIRHHEIALAREAIERLAAHPKITVLGPHDADRLSIISFNVEGLHYDLVSALLDHLFGIQNRAGCSCAGPYGHRLLGIDAERSQRLRALVRRGYGAIKPGWVRMTLPFYACEEDLEFLLGAVLFVADHGRSFVPLYRLDWRTGVWRHDERPAPDLEPVELTVGALTEAAQSFAAGDFESPLSHAQVQLERRSYFEQAEVLAKQLCERWRRTPPQWNVPTGDAELDAAVSFRYVLTTPVTDAVSEPP